MSASQTAGSLATTIGLNIRAARDAAGLTQRQLAALADVDSQHLSKWERGVHTPSAENLITLAASLGRTIAWFYTDHDKAAA